MTGLCFVDANVLVYARDPRAPAKQQRAKQWRDSLWRDRRGRTSTQALSEAYVALLRIGGAPPEEIWAGVERLFAWKPLPVSEEVLRRAYGIHTRWRISWWDSLIVAAAQLQGCELLLTEDLQDGTAFGSVTARSPFTLAVEQTAASYDAPSLLAHLHRPRGRPRRRAVA